MHIVLDLEPSRPNQTYLSYLTYPPTHVTFLPTHPHPPTYHNNLHDLFTFAISTWHTYLTYPHDITIGIGQFRNSCNVWKQWLFCHHNLFNHIQCVFDKFAHLNLTGVSFEKRLSQRRPLFYFSLVKAPVKAAFRARLSFRKMLLEIYWLSISLCNFYWNYVGPDSFCFLKDRQTLPFCPIISG